MKKTFRIAPNVETPKGRGRAKKARFGRDGRDNTNDFSLPGPPIEAKLVRVCSLLHVLCRSGLAQQAVHSIDAQKRRAARGGRLLFSSCFFVPLLHLKRY